MFYCRPLCRGPQINLQPTCRGWKINMSASLQGARNQPAINLQPTCKARKINMSTTLQMGNHKVAQKNYMSAPMNYFVFDVLNQSMDICQDAKLKNLYVTICATCGPYSTEFATMQTTMQTPITTTVNILIFQPLQVGCGLILGPLQNAKRQSYRT